MQCSLCARPALDHEYVSIDRVVAVQRAGWQFNDGEPTQCGHFHVCVIVTLLGLALWPAACALTFCGFDSLDQTRFIRHFHEFRTGAQVLVQPSDVEGLISFPSFHVAGALMVSWAFHRRRWWPIALVMLDPGLVFNDRRN
jgi:hypothetical protein